jgi:hypothetical protein
MTKSGPYEAQHLDVLIAYRTDAHPDCDTAAALVEVFWVQRGRLERGQSAAERRNVQERSGSAAVMAANDNHTMLNFTAWRTHHEFDQ